MNERKKAAIKMALVLLLAATVFSFFSFMKDTGDTVKIMVKPQEEKITSPFDFLFPSPSLINSWFYSDRIIVAAGSRMEFSARIFKLGEASIFSGSQKIAIIDVTENIDNMEVEESVNFENYVDESFPVKKGHKYRFALYTMNPDKETEIIISINGSDRIRTYFANKKTEKPVIKSEEKQDEQTDEQSDDSDILELPPDFGNIVRLKEDSKILKI